MPEPIKIAGQRLYRVDVTETKRAVFYVLADDLAAAKVDAKVLGEQMDDWDDYETDIDTTPTVNRTPRPEDMVWVGGEMGGYQTWGEMIDGDDAG